MDLTFIKKMKKKKKKKNSKTIYFIKHILPKNGITICLQK